MSQRSFVTDERGVSTAIAYTMAIGVTIVLVTGLLVSMSGMMAGQTDRATDTELRTVAEGVATEVTKLERVADRGSNTTAATRIDGPRDIVGSSYTVSLESECDDGQGPACLRVETADHERTVPLVGDIDVADSTAEGATMWLIVDAGTVSIQEDRPA